VPCCGESSIVTWYRPNRRIAQVQFAIFSFVGLHSTIKSGQLRFSASLSMVGRSSIDRDGARSGRGDCPRLRPGSRPHSVITGLAAAELLTTLDRGLHGDHCRMYTSQHNSRSKVISERRFSRMTFWLFLNRRTHSTMFREFPPKTVTPAKFRCTVFGTTRKRIRNTEGVTSG
jgi:hypothetical protein